MSSRLPLIPTAIVALAVAAMVALGFWQLGRAEEKQALLARYAEAGAMSSQVPWPQSEDEAELMLYRRSHIDCETIHGTTVRAGRNADNEPGQAHYADCETGGGRRVDVVLGWSRELPSASFDPSALGRIEGIIAPGPRLVADPPQLGLEANAKPDPADVPDNHLSYAVQWFLFALTALAIYALALRKKWRQG